VCRIWDRACAIAWTCRSEFKNKQRALAKATAPHWWAVAGAAGGRPAISTTLHHAPQPHRATRLSLCVSASLVAAHRICSDNLTTDNCCSTHHHTASHARPRSAPSARPRAPTPRSTRPGPSPLVSRSRLASFAGHLVSGVHDALGRHVLQLDRDTVGRGARDSSPIIELHAVQQRPVVADARRVAWPARRRACRSPHRQACGSRVHHRALISSSASQSSTFRCWSSSSQSLPPRATW
jgi:hypothetical protein